jgi:ribosome-associated protein
VSLDTESLLHFIVGVADDFKAVDRVVLRVDGVCDYADYFVIMSGTSTRHVQSIADELVYKCKHAGVAAASIEGLEAGEWCLLDFGSVVVHVFLPQKRALYDLESLWHEAEPVAVDETSNAP